MTARDMTRPFRRLGRKLKRSFKSKHGKLNILIILAGLLIVTAAGISVTGFLRQPGMDSYQPPAEETQSTVAAFSGNENESAGASDTSPDASGMGAGTAGNAENPDRENPDTEKGQVKPGSDQAGQTGSNPTGTKASEIQGAAGNAADNTGITEIPGTDENIADNAVGTDVQSAVENAAGSTEDWIEKKIAEHRSEIDPGDLQDFRAISAKLDQGYIRNIYKDGLTDDEQKELRDYLNSKLTSAEYERAKQLFAKYIYLLDGE